MELSVFSVSKSLAVPNISGILTKPARNATPTVTTKKLNSIPTRAGALSDCTSHPLAQTIFFEFFLSKAIDKFKF